ncbi:folylpolyglutamate synthase, mitochondrial-like isoform X2 [Leguminivora glycinivorella]|uniref:folylpolyglutamate synthase, mitochondrial-like isoform X2 n=1 Tax=Leguminivora glycinivorella TaxID=1035111 RepID=UPI00200ED8AA|nr:folylpolyglutamate synthase, mitochondrial-like isoform X2 [Leguminivora glycinivorella]
MIYNSCKSAFASLGSIRFARRMSSSKYSYEEAVRKLNLLQSNKSTIDQIRRNIKTGEKCNNIEEMANYLQRTGVSLDRLDELSVIHVAGTKGKGSTSAMCESILRAHGHRTGFYSSPHLCSVRERVRLSGRVLSREQFAAHCHRVYDALSDTQAFEGDMPKYFAFLTVLAYNIFLEERVDVAVVEVGIGGVVDYTNVLRHVPVVGITTLGLDHTSILGYTLAEIARAKAGIMKRGCEAYTVQQSDEAMEVLKSVASDVQCPLAVVPPYTSYNLPTDILQVNLPAYQTNASLAIQLAHAWLRHAKQNALLKKQNSKKEKIGGKILNSISIDAIFTENTKISESLDGFIPVETVVGLKECHWPGRYHKIDAEYATFYLDGAHTAESMDICAKWFGDTARSENRVLIFSVTGDRDAEILLKPLKMLNFNAVYFVIPTAYSDITKKNDNYSITEQKELVERCRSCAEIWKANYVKNCEVHIKENVSEALISIKRSYNSIDKSSVLFTGSLYLVGAALSIIDPNLTRD